MFTKSIFSFKNYFDTIYAAISQIHYVGTTAIAANRASAAQGLTGITSLTPSTNFILIQNAVNTLTSEEAGAVVNTLYLKAGKVGVGTTTPEKKLEVYGARNDVIRVGTNEAGTNLSTGIEFGNYSSGSFVRMAMLQALDTNFNMVNVTATGDINFRVVSTTNALTIKSSGKVGIGTTTPTYSLSFNGNSAQTIGLERHTTANTAGNSLTINASGATSAATDKNGGQLILKGGVSTGTGESGVTLQGYISGTSGTADCSVQDMVKIIGNKLSFYNVTPVVRPSALTAQLTSITSTAPGTPDYAIQDLTMVTPWGFASQDEGNTVLAVIANLQTRVAELETKLQSIGLLT